MNKELDQMIKDAEQDLKVLFNSYQYTRENSSDRYRIKKLIIEKARVLQDLRAITGIFKKNKTE